MNTFERLAAISFIGCVALIWQPRIASTPSRAVAADLISVPDFDREVRPILEKHCQKCHRAGEIAPFPLVTFEQAHAKAKKIADMVYEGKMPPWFADKCCGDFSNDPSLSGKEIETLVTWARGRAPGGKMRTSPSPVWTKGWNIPQPDVVLQMPTRVKLPARGVIEYTYEIVPTGFTEGKWVQMSEIRPSSRMNVHHAVVYVRPPDSQWLRHAPVGVPFTASDLTSEQDRREAHWTDADVLLVYAPGSSPDNWPAGMAKYVPAGSDIVFQMHYTAHGHATHDQSSIGFVFAKDPPKQRVLTLQLTNDKFIIPPGVDDYRVEARGTLPNDATLLSFLPHMHLRGKQFEYNIVHTDGKIETLPLKAGTMLQAVAWYDNSRKNPHNPDPNSAVYWGDQTTDEMMVGFFDVAVPANSDKQHFFIRDGKSAAGVLPDAHP
jgi:hypothetical protein